MKLKQVKKTESCHDSTTVYDITVDNYSSYCIDGVIVHNSACTTRKVTGK